MQKLFRAVFVFLALLAPRPAPNRSDIPEVPISEVLTDEDPRLERLKEFFLRYDSPGHLLAEHFILAADRNNLDWRLLPSIAIVESGAGKAYKNNNILGWDSCRQGFPTVPDGLYRVAERLSSSSLYKEKSLDAILRTYNADPAYAPRVKALMRALGPADLGAEIPSNRARTATQAAGR